MCACVYAHAPLLGLHQCSAELTRVTTLHVPFSYFFSRFLLFFPRAAVAEAQGYVSLFLVGFPPFLAIANLMMALPKSNSNCFVSVYDGNITQ